MSLGTFLKQPVERMDYDVDFTEWLTAGDNVDTCDVTSSDPALVIDEVTLNDPRVKVWLTGGTSGKKYKVSLTATTADGRIKQVEFSVSVKDT